jgi:hypothetical protein
MNPQPWAYVNVMENSDKERAAIENNHIFNKLVETVHGDMDENDGWFTITLTTGAMIEYKYVFRPHTKYELPHESYFRYRNYPNDIAHDLGIDTFLLEYAGMGFLYGALTMYVEHKLGLE